MIRSLQPSHANEKPTDNGTIYGLTWCYALQAPSGSGARIYATQPPTKSNSAVCVLRGKTLAACTMSQSYMRTTQSASQCERNGEMCWSLPLGFVLWPPANGLCWPLWPHHIHRTGQSERCFNALPSATISTWLEYSTPTSASASMTSFRFQLPTFSNPILMTPW